MVREYLFSFLEPVSTVEKRCFYVSKCGQPNLQICDEMMIMSDLRMTFLTANICRQQCDQIGRFLKVLVNKFAYKSSPKILVTFGLCRKRSIDVKAVVNIIQATFVNIWATLLLQHLVTLATNKTRKANKSFLAKHYFAYNIRTQQVDLPHKFCSKMIVTYKKATYKT